MVPRSASTRSLSMESRRKIYMIKKLSSSNPKIMANSTGSLFSQLKTLTTEDRNRNTSAIDMASVPEALRLINAEDKKVAAAVGKEIGWIGKAVNLVVKSFRSGGRLIYVGAGTSGRVGILDA